MKKVLPREKTQTTLDEIISIMQNTQKKRQALSQIPLERKLEVINELGKLWSSPDYSRRKLLIEFCAEQTGYSKEMVKMELSFVPIMLNPESLLNHFNQLPGGPKSIDRNIWVNKGECFRNLPKGNIFVVGAGNSFAPHLLTTLISLLTNNFVILRPSQSNCIALEEFKESFTELESEYSSTARIMSEAFEVVYTGHDSPAFDYLLKEAEINVFNFWGGKRALDAILEKINVRSALDRPSFVINGPMVGMAVIQEGSDNLETIARGLAYDIALFDQKLCSSPVEAQFVGSEEVFYQFAQLVGETLEIFRFTLPQRELDSATIRNTHIARKTLQRSGAKVIMPKDHAADWTVIASEKNPNLDVAVEAIGKTPHGTYLFNAHARPRLIEIVRVDSIDEALNAVRNLNIRRQYKDVMRVQSLGYSVKNSLEFIKKTSEIGVFRSLPIGEMNARTLLEPMDGINLAIEFTRTHYSRRSSKVVKSVLVPQRLEDNVQFS